MELGKEIALRLQKHLIEINNFILEPDRYQNNRHSKKIQPSIKIN